MKVLYLTRYTKKGGAAKGNHSVMTALQHSGCEVVPYSSDDATTLAKFVRNAERFCDINVVNSDFHGFKFAASTINLREAVSQVKPDVIQVGDICNNLVDYRVLSTIGIPTVHRLSDLWPYALGHHYFPTQERVDFKKFLMKFVGADTLAPSHVVAPSYWIKNRVSEFNFYVSTRCTVIRNSGEKLSRVYERRNVNEKLTLGFSAGSIWEPRKGLQALLRLISTQFTQNEVQILIAGKGEKKYISNSEKYLGFLSNERYRTDFFDKIDILLVPSIEDNSPNVIIECLERGIPVICQSGSGLSEYVKSGISGFKYDFQNDEHKVGEFRSICFEILKHYLRYSRGSHSEYCEYYHPKVIGRQYLGLYEKLLGG